MGTETAHVLFVDDEEPNLVVFEAVCGEDFPVLTASSAAAGLELMEKHPVGVVLTDQRMPGMTGIELLEKVQAEYPDTIRLLITAYSDLQAAEDAINRGHVRRYLRKPWEPEALKAELRDAIDLYNLNSKVKQLQQRLLHTERLHAAAALVEELEAPFEDAQSGLDSGERAIEQIKMMLKQGSPDTARVQGMITQVLEAMGDVGDGLSRIGNMLDEVRSTDRPPAVESSDLNDVIRTTIAALERSGLRGRALIRVDSGGPVFVAAPMQKIEGLAVVLLANAIQTAGRMPKGQGTVRVKTSVEGDKAVLEVSDNAPGPGQEELLKMMDLSGAGMRMRSVSAGLRAVKRLVKGLGGDLAVTALKEGGTQMRVALPKG